MKKIKLLAPLLGITATAGAIVPLAVSCNNGEDPVNPDAKEFTVTLLEKDNFSKYVSIDTAKAIEGTEYKGTISVKKEYADQGYTIVDKSIVVYVGGMKTLTDKATLSTDKKSAEIKLDAIDVTADITIGGKVEQGVVPPGPTPGKHAINIGNIVGEESGWTLACDRTAYTIEELTSEGIELTFTAEQTTSTTAGIFIPTQINAVTIQGATVAITPVTEYFVDYWYRDEMQDYVWHLDITPDDAELISILKNADEMHFQFRVQDYDWIPVHAWCEDSPLGNEVIELSTYSLNEEWFNDPLILAVDQSGEFTSVSIDHIAINNASDEPVILVEGTEGQADADYWVEVKSPTAMVIHFTELGCEALSYYWYNWVETLDIYFNLES